MIEVAIQHEVTVNGVMLRVFHAQKGEGIPRHQHAHDPVTMCHAGSIVARKEGRELVMTKDTQPVNLVGNEWHEIEALEDGTVFVNVFVEGGY